MAKPRVLLIGWDAADWKVIQPLLDAGEMPNLAKLISGGLRGNIATLYPALSPMLWTSIATGKRAYKHGVHGFAEPLPDGSGVRPISLLSRQTKAVWNILNQTGHRSLVVGWWPSHPAEPINGVMVSNHFPRASGKPGENPPMPAGTIHPETLAAPLGELRVHPLELTGEMLRLFVPDYNKVDQSQDKRLHTLAKVITETMSIHAVATELLEKQEWDFAAIYYCGLDHFGHGFMSYHPPRLPHVSEQDFAIYRHVIANAYRYHDTMLGMLLNFTDVNTTVILMSDHGFHPDEKRPEYIPAEPAGPAIEHRHFGILCLKGPGLRANEPVLGASLLDICPTILTLFGLPPGQDMDGKVLLTAFKDPPQIKPIKSWDAAAGNAGTHSAETQLDPVASAEAFKQLVELGYVAPPGPNVKETVDECVRELKYNLARSFRDGNCCAEAAAIAEELWQRWPKEHRFGLLLIEALLPLREVSRRRTVIEELARRMERYQAEAKIELLQCEQSQPKPPTGDSPDRNIDRRAHFEEKRLRELAHGRPLLLEWLFISQALLENQRAEARSRLERITVTNPGTRNMKLRIAGALAQLGDHDKALGLFKDLLAADPENPEVQAKVADIHFKARRFEQAIDAATESLTLLYFQPGVHALLGEALVEIGRFAEAEKALLVAVAQSPRNLVAHEALAKLYREHLNQPEAAFAHEGRSRTLRHELATRDHQLASHPSGAGLDQTTLLDESIPSADEPTLPPAFPADVEAKEIITVVSGLPRSGTSLMMQLLTAAGREALTDGKRGADEDNPLGYYEHEKTLDLAKDASWIPQARGRVVKIVAQLLPFLPRNEHYHIVFMERNLGEIVASQKAMLQRQARPGAALEEVKLAETYQSQVQRVISQMISRPEIRLLPVQYNALLGDPAGGVARLAEFLGNPFDRDRAIAAVRPELRRQKR